MDARASRPRRRPYAAVIVDGFQDSMVERLPSWVLLDCPAFSVRCAADDRYNQDFVTLTELLEAVANDTDLRPTDRQTRCCCYVCMRSSTLRSALSFSLSPLLHHVYLAPSMMSWVRRERARREFVSTLGRKIAVGGAQRRRRGAVQRRRYAPRIWRPPPPTTGPGPWPAAGCP